MKLGIAATAAVLGLATLVGCGQRPAEHRTATVAVTASDSSLSFNSFGVQWQTGTLLDHAASPEKANKAESADDVVVQPPIAPPSCPGRPAVHFATPEAAMTYLAAAWNRNDLAALCQVTNPNARFLLNDMHREAVNLRLKKCETVDVGRYSCTFVHDYPAKMHKSGTGRTWLDVAAADNPGWYMTVFEGCG
jgi:hypothetical protein